MIIFIFILVFNLILGFISGWKTYKSFYHWDDDKLLCLTLIAYNLWGLAHLIKWYYIKV